MRVFSHLTWLILEEAFAFIVGTSHTIVAMADLSHEVVAFTIDAL